MTETKTKGDDVKTAMGVLHRKLNRQLAVSMHGCVHCGVCSDACQFFLAARDPKMSPVYKAEVLRKLYKRRYDWMGRLFPAWVHGEDPSEEALAELYDVAWGSCTMCRRCTFRCPMGIDTALLIRTARSMLQACGRVPKGLQDTVDAHLKTGNNMSMKREDFIDTAEWMQEELQKDIDDPSAKIPVDKVGAEYMLTLNPREAMFYPLLLQAQAKVLNVARADWTLSSNVWDATNYALFNGDDVAAKEISRKLCDEAERLQVKTVLMTECGHGYRVMRFEAANWLGRRLSIGVKSFNEVVADWVRQGSLKLDPSRNTESVTYHDPCNQARSGGIVDEPRYLLKRAVEDFREMTPNGVDNICCGGGGGALTMGEFRSRRLEVGRVKAEQIAATGAKIVATSCHNCIDQIFELNRHYKLGIKVHNLCELIAEAVILPSKKAPIDIDELGYLKEPSLWDQRVAQFLANEHRVGELTDNHWRVIEFVREWNTTYKSWAVPVLIKKHLGIDPRHIFPGDPVIIYKVAGIKNPGNCTPWDARYEKDELSEPVGRNATVPLPK